MSLRRYILLLCLLIAAVLSAINGYAIYRLYHWGLDDSSEFYLWRDAERALTQYESEGTLPPGDGFLRFYARLDEMPEAYRLALAGQGWQAERMELLELPGESVYALPFRLPDGAAPAWVLHRFTAADDEGYTGLSFSELTLLLLVGSAPPLLLIAYALFRAIARPIGRLSAWAEALPGLTQAQAPEPGTLRFRELQSLAARLHQAFGQIARHNEHEQRFLQTLSHELRTPLAVIRAALEVQERQQGPATGSTPLARITRANQTMVALAESLLWLWREGGHEPEKQSLSLRDTLDTLWSELSASGLSEGFELRCTVPPEVSVHMAPTLLRVVLGNLLRNALAYGQRGAIDIYWAAGSLHMDNTIAPAGATPSREPGFGLGLYLVRRIAERQGWTLTITREEAQFSLSLGLHKPTDSPPAAD